MPQGGNTGYCGGATPDESGLQLVVGLRRLNRIRQVDAANFSLVAEAGCTLGAVQRASLEAERYFPLELGSSESCQIGGNLATNAGGLNVVRYGMARSLTLGIEVVLADGRVLEHLRALPKDNTGYDLTGLMIGSEGTLGIITAATLKLWPPPLSTATAFVAVPDLAAAVELLSWMRARTGDRITSFELLPRSAPRVGAGTRGGHHRPARCTALMVRIARAELGRGGKARRSARASARQRHVGRTGARCGHLRQ